MNTGLTVSQRAEQRYQEGSDLTSDIITMIYEDVAETLRLTAPPSLVAGLLVTGLLSCIILAWGRSRLTVGRAVSLFLFLTVTFMIIFKTLIFRELWEDPLNKLMGGWWIWNVHADGRRTLTAECFENIIMTIPFGFFFLMERHCSMRSRRSSRTSGRSSGRRPGRTSGAAGLRDSLRPSLAAAFSLSLCVELMQTVFRLGTFQLADLFYNTLGGGLGGLAFWIWMHMFL